MAKTKKRTRKTRKVRKTVNGACCKRCCRYIIGGKKGMATHTKRRHRGGKKAKKSRKGRR